MHFFWFFGLQSVCVSLKKVKSPGLASTQNLKIMRMTYKDQQQHKLYLILKTSIEYRILW